jgi:hypothetical protein
MTLFNKSRNANKAYSHLNAKIDDKEVDYVYTINAFGYQLHSIWKYKCKKHGVWLSALGISFKTTESQITKADLIEMRNEADENATFQFLCTPTAMYRWKLILKKYVPVTKNDVDKNINEFRIKQENKDEYLRVNQFIDFNLSYDKAKKKYDNAVKEGLTKGKFYNKEDFYTLRKIVKNEKMSIEEKKKAKKVKFENLNLVNLYRKIGRYKK